MSVLIICFSCRLSECLVGEIMVIDSNWSTLSFGRESSCGLWKNLESGAFLHLFSVRTELQWTGNHQCVTLKGWEHYRNALEEKQLNSPQMDRLSLSFIFCLFCSFSLDEEFVKAISPSSRKGRVETPVKSKLGDWTAINLPRAVLYASL